MIRITKTVIMVIKVIGTVTFNYNKIADVFSYFFYFCKLF